MSLNATEHPTADIGGCYATNVLILVPDSPCSPRPGLAMRLGATKAVIQAPTADTAVGLATSGRDGRSCRSARRRMRDSNSRGVAPTRFPSVRPSVHGRPCASVTWDDRDRWALADAREFQRMRLRMRLRLGGRTDSGQPGPRALARPDTRRARTPEPAAPHRVGGRQSGYVQMASH